MLIAAALRINVNGPRRASKEVAEELARRYGTNVQEMADDVDWQAGRKLSVC